MTVPALFVSDLDGTLLTTIGRLSARSGAVLAELIGAGHAFTIATARSFSTAHRVLAGLPLELPMIVSNGAFVVPPDGGAPVRSALLGREALTPVLDTCDAHGVPPIVFWTDGDHERVSWIGGAASEGIRAFLRERPDDERLLPIGEWSEIDAATVFLVSVLGDGDDVDLVRGALTDTDLTLALQVDGTEPARHVLDVTGPGATKGDAARRLAADLGAERLVVFGDGPNDLPMFAAADECYAVANAETAVLAAATGIIGSNDDDGVAEYLRARLG